VVIVLIILLGWAFFGGNKAEAPAENSSPTTSEDSSGSQTTSGTTQNQTVTKPAVTTSVPEPAQIVTYTDSGFSPSIVTIKRGESIKFVNESSEFMWVASNPHPTHTIYPGFDEGKAVGKGGSYTFTFNKTGDWGYHNHVRNIRTGRIVVKYE